MKSLYTNGFEQVFDDMYQTFINYQEEFECYSSILLDNNTTSVLEIGCGTGHLAKLFIDSTLHYQGLDLSQDMIAISKKRNPTGDFITHNMTTFTLIKPIDAIIITGRTTSYLLDNNTVSKALKRIHSNLNDEGILCFDFIDASRFFLEIKGGKSIVHQASTGSKKYSRESYMKANTALDNMMFDWEAAYYIHTNNQKKHLITDTSTVRAFTKNEWELLLALHNFELIDCIDKKSYAFDTYVIVAKKR